MENCVQKLNCQILKLYSIGIIRKESNQPAVHPENCLLMRLWCNSLLYILCQETFQPIEYVGGPSQVNLESISTTSKILKIRTLKHGFNQPKTLTMCLYYTVIVINPNDADRMANNVDPDLTDCTFRSNLIFVYTVC